MRKQIRLAIPVLGVCAAVACNPASNQRNDTTGSLAAPVQAGSGAAATVRADPMRKWTFMVYMNGDNNLESFALQDFREMARVGSTDDVNIVVQLDRTPGFAEDDADDWTDTRRFRVIKGMEPRTASADPTFAQEVNMGSPDALRDFVQWATARYPAERLALVIWDHGDGFRFFANRPELTKATRNARIARVDSLLFGRLSETGTMMIQPAAKTAQVSLPNDIGVHPVKAASHDETSGTVLYNRQIQTALEQVLNGKRLDIFAFDACLMAMVENAYAFRNVANVFVGSEELEPGEGWQYERVLRPLVNRPAEYTAESFGQEIVKAYEATYGALKQNTTLSAIDLRQVGPVVTAASDLGTALTNSLSDAEVMKELRAARNACGEYGEHAGSRFHNVDMKCFASRLESSMNIAVRTAAQRYEQARAAAVLAAYADKTRSTPGYVSSGLAIYFPGSGAAYTSDPLHLVYQDGLSADKWPVQFVDDYRWDNFLAKFAATTFALVSTQRFDSH